MQRGLAILQDSRFDVCNDMELAGIGSPQCTPPRTKSGGLPCKDQMKKMSQTTHLSSSGYLPDSVHEILPDLREIRMPVHLFCRRSRIVSYFFFSKRYKNESLKCDFRFCLYCRASLAGSVRQLAPHPPHMSSTDRASRPHLHGEQNLRGWGWEVQNLQRVVGWGRGVKAPCSGS